MTHLRQAVHIMAAAVIVTIFTAGLTGCSSHATTQSSTPPVGAAAVPPSDQQAQVIRTIQNNPNLSPAEKESQINLFNQELQQRQAATAQAPK